MTFGFLADRMSLEYWQRTRFSDQRFFRFARF
jgi:hypothetical protein